MREFLLYLEYIRKRVNKNKIDIYMKLGILLIFTLFLGFSFDTFLPWNIYVTTFRAFIALIISITIFTLGYAISLKEKSLKNKNKLAEIGNKLREDLSLNQRINLSIILVINSFVLHFLLVKTETTGYTVVSGLIMTLWIYLIYFIRPTKDEIKLVEYDVEDDRDIKHDIKNLN